MNDTTPPRPLQAAPSASSAGAQIGVTAAVNGMRLTCRLGYGGEDSAVQLYARAPIGALVKIPTANSVAYGFIGSEQLLSESAALTPDCEAVAEIDLLGAADTFRPV